MRPRQYFDRSRRVYRWCWSCSIRYEMFAMLSLDVANSWAVSRGRLQSESQWELLVSWIKHITATCAHVSLQIPSTKIEHRKVIDSLPFPTIGILKVFGCTKLCDVRFRVRVVPAQIEIPENKGQELQWLGLTTQLYSQIKGDRL